MNPTHSKKRQRNDLMHELSHIILKHKPNRIDVTRDGLLILKNYEKTQEEEADWLAGCLLLPRKLLLQVVKQRNSMEQTSDNLGVSVALLKYRINVTGISRQMARGS
jgi:Zn-dependent peptidase ImmA (M78 family)